VREEAAGLAVAAAAETEGPDRTTGAAAAVSSHGPVSLR
jgi:hypothetical protein